MSVIVYACKQVFMYISMFVYSDHCVTKNGFQIFDVIKKAFRCRTAIFMLLDFRKRFIRLYMYETSIKYLFFFSYAVLQDRE